MAEAQVVEARGGLRLFMRLVRKPKPIDILAGVRARDGGAWIELRHISNRWVVEIPNIPDEPIAPWFKIKTSGGDVLEVKRAGPEWELYINGHRAECIKAGRRCYNGNDIARALRKVATEITCGISLIEILLI
jgi:hypothetical protein